MFRDLYRPETFRQRFFRSAVLPLIAVLVLASATAVFILYWATTRADETSVGRQAGHLQAGMFGVLGDLAREQRSDALWPPLERQLNEPVPDQAWLDAHVGRWLYTAFGHQQVYILAANGQPRFAWVNGQRVPAGTFDRVRAALLPLVDRVRGAARETVAQPGTPLPLTASPSLAARAAPNNGSLDVNARPAVDRGVIAATDSGALQFLGFTRIDDQVAEVAVVAVRAASETGGAASATPPAMMVNVRYIDTAYLLDLSRRCGTSRIHFSPRPSSADGERAIALADVHGGTIGYLVWRPDRPGHEILLVIGPVAMTVLVVIGLIFWFLSRMLWRSSSALANTVIELRASEAHAQHLAFHDVLTGLPNRALFEDRISQAMAHTRRGQTVALLALDVDRFKHVNDTFGHHAGDTLIREVASRLSSVVRATDTVARVGGDEFVIIQMDVGDHADVETLCRRILEAVRRPFILLGNELHVGVSIGVALAPTDATERSELMRKADIALYTAKRDGRDRHHYFTQSMDDTVRLRHALERELRLALSRPGELQVYYQPEVSPDGRRVIGLEALVRWQHPQRGMILPEEFVPIAEETGMIMALGEWVLGEACIAAQRWPAFYIAVNLSPAQFRSPDFAARIIGIVESKGCHPSRIQLEITEGILLGDDEHSRQALTTLREAGFQIALDDFGTGYSSLSYLRRFQVDKIKIDRSFTQNLDDSNDAVAIVKSVVALGRAMGLTVTAEGVETREQMNALARVGCDELQGYLFSKAVPADQIAAMVLQMEQNPVPEVLPNPV